jgi:hypothetical protein
MKSTERFFREVHAAAKGPVEDLTRAFDGTNEDVVSPAVTRQAASDLHRAVRVLGDAIAIVADHDKQAKARRDRVVWIHFGQGLYVALVGRKVFRYDADTERVWTHDRKGGRIDMGKALDTVGASRKVRAWRKKQ